MTAPLASAGPAAFGPASAGGDAPAARRLAFLHLPKTAGTSLLATLGNAFGERHMRRLHGAALEPAGMGAFLDSPEAVAVRCLAGHFGLHALAGRREGFAVFTVLRHPIERVMSLYRFLRRREAGELERLGLAPGFDFDAFLGSRAPELFGQIRNGMCRALCGDPAQSDPRGAAFWAEAMPAAAVEAAVANLDGLCFGLADRMGDTLALLRAILGFPLPLAEHAENASDPAGPERSTRALQQLAALNTGDLALHLQAVALFERRLGGAVPAIPGHRPAPIDLGVLAAGRDMPVCDIPGRQGFHAFEAKNGFSWLAGRGPARIAVAGAPSPARLRLRLYRVAESFPVAEIRLAADGVPVAHHWTAEDAGWGMLESEPFALGPLGVIALEAPYSVPARFLTPASPDGRALSVAVSAMALLAC